MLILLPRRHPLLSRFSVLFIGFEQEVFFLFFITFFFCFQCISERACLFVCHFHMKKIYFVFIEVIEFIGQRLRCQVSNVDLMLLFSTVHRRLIKFIKKIEKKRRGKVEKSCTPLKTNLEHPSLRKILENLLSSHCQ